jgi:putative endonuclease
MFGITRKNDAHDDSGKWGEKCAERYLKRAGYILLGTRVKVPPHDEIDLVMRDGEELVFVEVKTRKSEEMGAPIDAVNREKQRFLSRAAIRFLKNRQADPIDFRFDVVEVIGKPGDENPTIRHHEDAFELDDNYRPPF